MHHGVDYKRNEGHQLIFEANGREASVEFDDIVVCAGQLPYHPLAEDVAKLNVPFTLIGGARKARDLDAQRAIREGLEAAYNLSPWKLAINRES